MSSTGVPQKSRAGGPGFFLFVCALLLAYSSSYLDAVGHFVLVEHVRCAEHGRLVHGEEAEVDQALDEGEFGSAAGARASVRGDAPPREHEHEHCDHGFGGRVLSHQAAQALTTVIEKAQFRTARATFLPAQLLLARRVLEFAPKTSPPICG